MISTVFYIALLRLWNNKQELLLAARRSDLVLQHFRRDLWQRCGQWNSGH